tara:strand:+ start:24164 stop:24508 length:345 start_codon:yes stop_codon:yes gene_type:complete
MTLIKYLEFLKKECLRYYYDNKVNENELQLFNLEIKRFKKLLENSNLDKSTKEIVNKLNFEFSPLIKNKEQNIIISILGNIWSNQKQKEENLSNRLKNISDQIEHTIIELKMHT